VAVITTVDIDHAEWLGEDREAIGTEKAGIIRGWKPVILGETDPPSSVLRRAYLVGAKRSAAAAISFRRARRSQRWRWRDVGPRMELPHPRWPARSSWPTRRPPSPRCARWTCRCRVRRGRRHGGGARGRAPAAFERDGVQIRVDVGHNPQAAGSWRDWLADAAAGARWRCTPRCRTRTRWAWCRPCTRIDGWWLAGLDGLRARQGVDAFAARLAGTAAATGERMPA
jgi:dihydrofolate synthase/folylpolyglutamate synthase